MAGFTMVELMIALIVLAIVLAMALPGYREVALNAAIRGVTMDLITAVNTARAQAVSLRQDIDVVPLAGVSWDAGIRIDYPAAAVEADQEFAPRANVSVTEAGGINAVRFLQSGLLSSGLDFTVCDVVRSGETGRRVQVSLLGRIDVTEVACP